MIKNLIFDFGKVLVDYDYEGFFQQYIHDKQIYDNLLQTFAAENWQEEFDLEINPMADILQQKMELHPEFANEIQYMGEHYLELVTGEIEGMRELMQRLKAEGFRLFGLSNWCQHVKITMQQYPIFKLLEGSIISSDIHITKPSAAIYQTLLNRFGLKAEECIFTDDKAPNIAAGEQLGIRGIVFQNAAQYERDLRILLTK